MPQPSDPDDHAATERNPTERNPGAPSYPADAQADDACAVLTGPGRAAIAVIEVRGPRAAAALGRLIRFASDRPLAAGQVRYGTWRGEPARAPSASDEPRRATEAPQGPTSSPGESVVVVPLQAARFEVHCHGGSAAVGRLLEDLAGAGIPVRATTDAPHATAEDWGRLSGSPQQVDRLIVEARQCLIRCITAPAAAMAMDQVRGALRMWRDAAIAALQGPPGETSSAATVIARRAAELAGYGHLGVRLNRPFDVVLAGPPNVGKSSLINAMVGFDRSITMDVAGTTRDVLDAETVFDGWPLRLRDTAGLHESQEQIEREGISRALAAIAAADLVVLVAEPGLSHATPQLEAALEQLNRPLPVIPVLNKSDLPPAGGEDSFASGPALQQRTEDEGDEALLETVATSGRGVANLLERIVTRLVGRLPPAGAPVPINQRQWDHVRRIAALGDQPRAMLDELQAL